MILKGDINSGATFSECGLYRYNLWRRWSPGLKSIDTDMVAFLGLNPSTADETEDDPTIRRCIGFAKSWGCSGMVMLNIFAFRATDPAVMKAAVSPVGPNNDWFITEAANQCAGLVCCWGAHGKYQWRGAYVQMMLHRTLTKPAWHLGLTKDGMPRHPLYLAANTERVLWWK